MAMEIREIIKRQSALFGEGDAEIARACRAIKDAGKSVVIFGAGQAGRLMKQKLTEEGVGVEAFVDNNVTLWGCEIEGVRVISPKDIPTDGNTMVLISSWDSDSILLQLRALGISCIDQTFYSSVLVQPQRDFYRANLDKVMALEAVLFDEESKNVLRSLILHVLTLDRSLLTAIHNPHQYFFDRSFAIRPGDTIVDGGAFIGDTVEDIIGRYGPVFKKMHCFEPNEINFRKLTEYVETKGLSGKVLPHDVGLWDSTTVLHYSGSGSSFHLSEPGEPVVESIKTVTLDEFFTTEKVDFIKMDLEGVEPISLRGGEKLITRDRPRLAICVYHFPGQLWEIPFQIRAMVPEYRLMLRNHTDQHRETVIYATMDV